MTLAGNAGAHMKEQVSCVKQFSIPWQVKMFVPSWGKQGNFNG